MNLTRCSIGEGILKKGRKMEVAIKVGDENGGIEIEIGDGKPHGVDEESHGEGR